MHITPCMTQCIEIDDDMNARICGRSLDNENLTIESDYSILTLESHFRSYRNFTFAMSSLESFIVTLDYDRALSNISLTVSIVQSPDHQTSISCLTACLQFGSEGSFGA